LILNIKNICYYPSLSDLVSHYRNLISLKENKKNLFGSFPEKIKKADFENFKVLYEKIIEDDAIMQEVENIVNYSIPQFESSLAEGKKIYDYIEEHIYISPIGIIPLNPDEGYLFLKDGSNKETKVYQYQITIFDKPEMKYRGIHTHFIRAYERTITNTFESIKTELIRFYRELPNPATYVVETEMILPLEETFLPMAKRTLLKYVSHKE
jgi:hypothetical protein